MTDRMRSSAGALPAKNPPRLEIAALQRGPHALIARVPAEETMPDWVNCYQGVS